MSIEAILLLIFCLGYFAIIFEHKLGFDKAGAALITGVVLWTVWIMTSGKDDAGHRFMHEFLPEISSILLFLLGAMTIVEIIDQHQGFELIVSRITTNDKRLLLWIIALLTFFLSAILDNLTTAIVMVSLLRKKIANQDDRLFFAGIVVIAANSGGAWSPMGDITTTMLWIKGQITALSIIKEIFLASAVSLLVPLIVISFIMKGKVEVPVQENQDNGQPNAVRWTVFILGVLTFISVPIFKTVTHLPPFMGMLLGLGIMWVITDLIHKEKNAEDKFGYSVYNAMSKIDSPSILFFFGILTAVSALDVSGILKSLAQHLDASVGNHNIIIYTIGLLSAVIDNVPLVSATQSMYSFPTDHHLWHFIAYCAGTGGSILIIGSAAGVAVMGIEKINFMWYAKRIGWLAFLGYTAGAIVSVLETHYFGNI